MPVMHFAFFFGTAFCLFRDGSRLAETFHGKEVKRSVCLVLRNEKGRVASHVPADSVSRGGGPRPFMLLCLLGVERQ